MAKTVLFLIASVGYQSWEYQKPKKIIEDAGFNVVTASDAGGMAVAHDEHKMRTDLSLDHVNIADYAAIVLIGGPGALEHLDNPFTHQLIKDAMGAHKIVAAICISPRILAKAGALKNKKATGWNDDKLLDDIFSTHHVQYIHEQVVTDDNVITAAGPIAAEHFGTAIVTALKHKH